MGRAGARLWGRERAYVGPIDMLRQADVRCARRPETPPSAIASSPVAPKFDQFCYTLFRVPEVVCCAKAGGLVDVPAYAPRFRCSETPEHRRVIHLEYANEELPNGLDWNREVS